MNRILIAGTGSGCGKTTVTLAILAALRARGLCPAAYKCGPDYADPMLHRAALGIPAYNLDPYFLPGDGLAAHLAAHGGEPGVVEGAMGYYDGIAATEEASAYQVAKATGTPAVLVLGARGANASLGAVMEGFLRHRPDSGIAGVIFDGAGESRRGDLRRIAEAAGLRAYGCLEHREEWSVPSRRLGLLAAEELPGLRRVLSGLGRAAEATIDLDGLLRLAGTAPAIHGFPAGTPGSVPAAPPVRCAVARDEAFRFLYEENLELLRSLGCETVFFSPLRDKSLPEGIGGLYLPGGYPELHAGTLAGNRSLRSEIREAVRGGLPTVAEGGGFLFLHEAMGDAAMCGVIPGRAFDAGKLSRFGYTELTAERDNLLCEAGETIRAHEFHYWESGNPGGAFVARKAGRELTYPCAHATETLYAGFPQLYFPGKPSVAGRFVERMRRYHG